MNRSASHSKGLFPQGVGGPTMDVFETEYVNINQTVDESELTNRWAPYSGCETEILITYSFESFSLAGIFSLRAVSHMEKRPRATKEIGPETSARLFRFK